MKKKQSRVKRKISTKKAPSRAVVQKKGIQPLSDRVLVRPLSAEELSIKNAAGIIIPETIDKEKPMQGTVIAVGPGRFDDDGNRIPMDVAPGDRVVFSKYSPDEIKIDGNEYYILNESSILAVIR